MSSAFIDIQIPTSEIECEWEKEETPSGVSIIHIRIGNVLIHMDVTTWNAIIQARKDFRDSKKP